MIPKKIYLCYKHKNIPSVVLDEIKSLNPEYKVDLFGNHECREFLGDEFGGDYADCFTFIPDGAIKADFWRCAIIFIRGGVYFDVDVHHLRGIHEYLDPNATFLTSTSWHEPTMNPIVLMSRPRNESLEICLNWYVSSFRNKLPYSYWGWSICHRLTEALVKTIGFSSNNKPQMIRNKNDLYQFVSEDKKSGRRQEFFTHWNDMKILNNHREEYMHGEGFKWDCLTAKG